MSIFIEDANIPIKQIVTALSRYKNSKVIYYGEQRMITLETYVRPQYVLTGSEQVMLITKGVEYRSDLVSNQYFGTPDVWWKILEINGMKDVWEFKAGKTITLPSSIY